MRAIKQILNSLTGKSTAELSPTAVLSSTEMDYLFGGKPKAVVSELSYWWIEDDEDIPLDSNLKLPNTLT